MTEKYTEAQAKAIRKYLDKTVAIQVRVTAEKRDEYKALAEAKGMSLSQYIINCVEQST